MTDQPKRRLPTSRRRTSLLAGAFFAASSALTVGCLDRPVVPQKPTTSNVFIEQVINTAIEEIDLLFVIDNSVSMADKQAILREAVPVMVGRLVTPDCVNEGGERQPNDGQDCASYAGGFAPEFSPIDDIHIGVITSSIGGFGSESCKGQEEMDKSLLIPKVRTMVPSSGGAVPDPEGTGFLAWRGGGAAEVTALQDDFRDHVEAAGESGCGFEAPLEAWYRFLVDPAPPEDVILEGTSSVSTGPSAAIIAQREEFLRPTSLVAIVVLTDENDCSAMEGGNFYANAGFGWLIADRNRTFPIAAEVCASNPNDRCCHSCLQPAPDGCSDTCGDDPPLPTQDDRANVRCFDNKRRFGVDLLYPTQRYVDGLSKSVIVNSRDGNQVTNPLLAGRQPDLVFFAGIVGVPWQDIATEASLSDPNSLEYLTADELRQVDDGLNADRWAVILGEPGLSRDAPECRAANEADRHPDCGKTPIAPLDPYMIESITPRDGANPITGEALVAPGGNGWSAINGHEYANDVLLADGLPANDDLQYSCIFPLGSAEKADCQPEDFACDCGDEPSKNRPLCKPSQSASAMADTTQRYGKAYPASRVLRVLRDFGENSIVASICPKILDDINNPSFGYNPAVNAIVDRLAEKLGGQCLPRELSVDEEGRVPCTVVEAFNGALDCAEDNGRFPVSEQIKPAVIKQLEATGRCTTDGSTMGATNCNDYNMCAIRQHTGDAERECFSSTLAASQDPGFCYIDPAKGPSAGGEPVDPGDPSQCQDGNPDTWGSCTNSNVAGCSATQRRLLRFVGPQTPVANSITFVACVGEAAAEGGGKLPALPDSSGN